MKFNETLDESIAHLIPDNTVIGIDIGSRQAKAVLLHECQVFTALSPTGFFMQETAEQLIDDLVSQAGINKNALEYLVSTGYGRVALSFHDVPNKIVTEISCHGMGAHYLDKHVHTIIDIGGQDSKAIRIDPENGQVAEFAMNDKCAAGTGRFLEKIAEVLGYDVTKIGALALTSKAPISISSQCVVFAESEVISERAKGVPVNDLAAGINMSVAKRVRALLGRVGIEKEILFTGGVSNNVGMRKAFEELLGCKLIQPHLDTVYAGALGAAIYAAQYAAEQKSSAAFQSEQVFELNTEALEQAVSKNTEAFIEHKTGKKKNVGYLCSYMPLELLNAADVSYQRLMHAGTQREILAGENYTQSVYCDITKSIIGGFSTGNPLNNAVDKLYLFDTCDCMHKSAEAINQDFVRAEAFHLPRKRHSDTSRAYLVGEMECLKEDLERFTGVTISEEKISQNIRLYNRARTYLKEISEYRKSAYPLITGMQFKKIISAFFSLPAEQLIPQLEGLIAQLRSAKPITGSKVRLMLSGGMVAQGDDKIVNIVEQELGARVVAEDNCTGLKPIYELIPETGNVYQALAEGYINQPPCFQMRPIDDAIRFSTDLAKEYDVDGVVFYYLKFCARYSIMAHDYLTTFQNRGIPILVLPGDYSNGDIGQIRTRLEAFVEVLQEKRNSK